MSTIDNRPTLKSSRRRPLMSQVAETTRSSPSPSMYVVVDKSSERESTVYTVFRQISVSDAHRATTTSSLPEDHQSTRLDRGPRSLGKSSSTSDTDSEPQQPRVAGCTASREKREWKVTDSMMKAYISMRGPMTGHGVKAAENDLCAWIDYCGKYLVPPIVLPEGAGTCTT